MDKIGKILMGSTLVILLFITSLNIALCVTTLVGISYSFTSGILGMIGWKFGI
jgi:hypothetical protein